MSNPEDGSLERLMETVFAVHYRVLGGPVQISLPDYTEECPLCRAKLTEEDHGYGLAYGGGLGEYITCPNDACPWWIKMVEVDSHASGGVA